MNEYRLTIGKNEAVVTVNYHDRYEPDLWGNHPEIAHYTVLLPGIIFSAFDLDYAFEYLKELGYEFSSDPFKIQQITYRRHPAYWFDYVGVEQPIPDFIDWTQVLAWAS